MVIGFACFAPNYASAQYEKFDVENDHLKYRIELLAQAAIMDKAEVQKFFEIERAKMSEKKAEAWQTLFNLIEGPTPKGENSYAYTSAVERLVIQYLSIITIEGYGDLPFGPEKLVEVTNKAIAYTSTTTGKEQTHPIDEKQWNIVKINTLTTVLAHTAENLQGVRDNLPNYRAAFGSATAAYQAALNTYGNATHMDNIPNHRY